MFESLRLVNVLHLRLHLVSKSYVRYPTETSHPVADAYNAALKDIPEKVSQRGARLVVIGPNPGPCQEGDDGPAESRQAFALNGPGGSPDLTPPSDPQVCRPPY